MGTTPNNLVFRRHESAVEIRDLTDKSMNTYRKQCMRNYLLAAMFVRRTFEYRFALNVLIPYHVVCFFCFMTDKVLIFQVLDPVQVYRFSLLSISLFL